MHVLLELVDDSVDGELAVALLIHFLEDPQQLHGRTVRAYLVFDEALQGLFQFALAVEEHQVFCGLMSCFRLVVGRQYFLIHLLLSSSRILAVFWVFLTSMPWIRVLADFETVIHSLELKDGNLSEGGCPKT